MLREGRVIVKGIIILLSVTVFVCHDKGNVFLYNKFTSICILEVCLECEEPIKKYTTLFVFI